MPQFKAPSCASTSTSSAASSESSSSDNAEEKEAFALQAGLESHLQPHRPDHPPATTATTRNTHDNDSRCVTIAVSRSSSSATARSSMYSDITDSDSDSGSRTDIPSLPRSSSVSATSSSSSSGSDGSNAYLLHQDSHRPQRVTGVPTTDSKLTFSPIPSTSTKHHLQQELHLGRETIKHERQRQLHRFTRDIPTLTRAARVAGRYSAKRVQRSLETLCGALAVLEAREWRRREIRKGEGKRMRKLTMGMGMGTGVGTVMKSGDDGDDGDDEDDGDDGLRGESGFVGGRGGGDGKVRFMGEQRHGHRRAGEENVRNDEVGETRARKGPGAAKVRKWLRAVLRT